MWINYYLLPAIFCFINCHNLNNLIRKRKNGQEYLIMSTFLKRSLFLDNMHLTEIVLKDGRKFEGIIERQRFDPDIFEHAYIKLDGQVLYIKNISSAITQADRISSTETGNVDEIKKMREVWEQYKRREVRGIGLVEEKYRLPSEH